MWIFQTDFQDFISWLSQLSNISSDLELSFPLYRYIGGNIHEFIIIKISLFFFFWWTNQLSKLKEEKEETKKKLVNEGDFPKVSGQEEK